MLGQTVKTKEHEIEVDDEVCETAQEYIDYVRRRAKGKALLVEQKFNLDALDTPFRAGGTGDAVILDDIAGLIEVVDLKGGRGIVVEASNNKQLRTYGLGAMMANPGPWKMVKVTIVQPRAPHPDGRIRSEEFSVAELVDWTSDLLAAMNRAKQAVSDYEKPGDWAETHLFPGDHCGFCKAQAVCPKVAQVALDEARAFFQPEGVTAPPEPKSLPMEQIVRVLDHADMIQNWLNAVRAYAKDQAEAGHDVTDGHSLYVLTDKLATRKWSVEDPVLDLAMETGRDAEDFYQEPTIMSPAMVEKLLGKKDYLGIEHLVKKESSGLNLVRSDKTSRPAVLAPVKQLFKPQEGA